MLHAPARSVAVLTLASLIAALPTSGAPKPAQISKELAADLADPVKGPKLRERYAREHMREMFLKKGMDINVGTHGPDNSRLQIAWVLMSAPLAYNLRSEMPASLYYKIGFREVSFTGGGYARTWRLAAPGRWEGGIEGLPWHEPEYEHLTDGLASEPAASTTAPPPAAK